MARNLTEVDLSGLDSSNIKNSYNMFYRCINLKSVKFDKFDTSKLYNISKMFSECSSLESINFDLSKWNNKDYTVRIRFTNQHLFWKAGWYLDGGRLVRTIYKI